MRRPNRRSADESARTEAAASKSSAAARYRRERPSPGTAAPLELAPIVAKDGHELGVPVAASDERVLPQNALDSEAGLLVRPQPAGVELVHLEPDPVQVQGLERVAHDEARGLGPVPLIPRALISDHDSESRVAIPMIDAEEPRGSDQPVALAD